MCKSFQYKQWWVFRSKQTLWGNFLQAKYFQRSNPIRKMWDTIDSQSWRYMMRHKHTIEAYIQWKIRSGTCFFLCDNWLGLRPLAQYTNQSNIFNNNTIADLMKNGQWNMGKVIQQAPSAHVHAILATEVQLQQGVPELPIWNVNTNGEFTCSSTWNIIR